MQVYPNEVIAFDMYLGSLASMNAHPGNLRENGRVLTDVDLVNRALALLKARRTMIPPEMGNGISDEYTGHGAGGSEDSDFNSPGGTA